MYLRMTQRRNRDGSTVAYYALAENAWNAAAKRAEARVVHHFGRADQLDRAALQRLVNSINRVLDQGEAVTTSTPELPPIEIEHVFELGVVLAAGGLWEDLGIGAAIRRCIAAGELTAPHEAALFAMAANRLDAPGSKLACAARWLPDVAFLPDAAGLAVDQLYRALDFLAVWSDRIEREVFLQAADLFRLDVDLIFYDTTTAYFEIDEADEDPEEWGGRLYALCAAAPARPQQGGPGQPASGHHRARGDPRRHAGPLVDPARGYRRRCHRGPDQGRPACLAARPLRVRRRCRHVFGREHGGALARSRPLYPGRADAQGEGDRARGSDPSGPLQAGCRQSPGQGGRGRRGRAPPPLRALPQSRGSRTPASASRAGAQRTHGRTQPFARARGGSSEGGLHAAGVVPLWPLSHRRLSGPPAARRRESQSRREIRRQVRRHQA